MSNTRNTFSQCLTISIIGTLLLSFVWWKQPNGSRHWESAIVWGTLLINGIVGSAGHKYRDFLALWTVGVLLLILVAWKWPNATELWDLAIMWGSLLVYGVVDYAGRKRGALISHNL